MSLIEARKRILEKLWEESQPMRVRDVAERTGQKVSAATMYLLRLKKTGHVFTPQRGYYAITDLGKEAIGLPKIDHTKATKILTNVPVDKAFHFYSGINQYMNVYANSLSGFCDKIQRIDLKSMEFHVPRGDFENWFQSLGDEELAKRMGIIRNMNLSGEELRKKVYEAAKLRLEELKRICSV